MGNEGERVQVHYDSKKKQTRTHIHKGDEDRGELDRNRKYLPHTRKYMEIGVETVKRMYRWDQMKGENTASASVLLGIYMYV